VSRYKTTIENREQVWRSKTTKEKRKQVWRSKTPIENRELSILAPYFLSVF
jgi:hypothetical protein